ncbi:MAG TPA: hypothetical protein ENK28_04575 [Aliiroseovarius sp.]|nr:hypothetical protein [Aliiroseovarius sp.]
MTDHPILFSAPMVQALLEGRKTQTRRVLKGVPSWAEDQLGTSCFTPPGHIEFRGMSPEGYGLKFVKLPYAIGDRLWVREAWNAFGFSQDGDDAWPWPTIPTLKEIQEIEDLGHRVSPPQIVYKESDRARKWFGDQKWRPSIHMPRWASRITQIVTDVRAERLQDITDEDAKAEGVTLDRHTYQAPPAAPWFVPGTDVIGASPRAAYAAFWDSLNGKKPGKSWDDNPWVVATEFDVVEANIGEVGE